MKHVQQTRFYAEEDGLKPPGNCFQACLASVLDLELDEVPDGADHWWKGRPPKETWALYWQDVERFLADRGLAAVEIKLDGECPPVLNIISGPSPRNKDIDHCVVARGEKVIWDPHPDNKLILDGHHTHMFIVKNS
jgi:hypothetical protein